MAVEPRFFATAWFALKMLITANVKRRGERQPQRGSAEIMTISRAYTPLYVHVVFAAKGEVSPLRS